MLVFISLLFVLQATLKEDIILSGISKEGVRIILENTRFEGNKTIQWETRIMKLGDKLRIENTYPEIGEVCEVIIWDGKKCMIFIPNHKPQEIPPVRDGLEFLGFTGKVKENGVKWEIDANKLPLKKETRHEVTKYNDYTKIEGFGYFPAKIEKYRGNKLIMNTGFKVADDEAELSAKLFDPELVEFSAEVKKMYKE